MIWPLFFLNLNPVTKTVSTSTTGETAKLKGTESRAI